LYTVLSLTEIGYSSDQTVVNATWRLDCATVEQRTRT